MKKIYYLSYLIALFIYSCNQEDNSENQLILSFNEKKYTTNFEESESRVSIDEEYKLSWSEKDFISIFNGNTLNSFYQFDGNTGDKSGTFSHVYTLSGTKNDLETNYAVYPYATDVQIAINGIITATLPVEQSYVTNSFGLNVNTMVAVTKDTDDSFLNFKNVCGYLKLQLYGDNTTIKSIILKGNNNEKLAGKVFITPIYGQNPTMSMADDATEIIVLDCGEGVRIGSTIATATTFWMVVPPTTFEKGFTITVTKDNGINYVKSTSNEIVVERNTIKPMNVESVNTFEMEIVPNNQIWYTSSDGNIVNPKYIINPNFYSNPFGATIISNTYKKGKGVITFDKDLTTIGDAAFYQCETLESIILPNSVTSIVSAFSDCESLTSVTLPNGLTEISDHAFAHCYSLKDIIIPNGVTSINDYAFYDCKSLTSITIPDNVITIGNYAFYGCESFTNITIPDNVVKIGQDAFANCSSLASIVVEAGNSIYDSRDNCNAIIEKETNILIRGCKNTIIPNSVTSIGNYAFKGCSSLTEITIPNSVKTIGKWAFGMCHSLAKIQIPNSVTNIGDNAFYNCNNSLTEIIIPSSVTNIGKYAFLYCRSLNNITIPKSVVSVGSSIFAGCSSLTNIVVESGNSVYDSRDNSNAIIETATNTLVQGCENTVIPNSVTSIGDGAFMLNSMVEFIIPENITTIGKNAFDSCESLTRITIPKNVTSIGDEAFWSCSSLLRIDLKAQIPPTIASGTFKDCNNNLKIYVPATSIESYEIADFWKEMNLLPNN